MKISAKYCVLRCRLLQIYNVNVTLLISLLIGSTAGHLLFKGIVFNCQKTKIKVKDSSIESMNVLGGG